MNKKLSVPVSLHYKMQYKFQDKDVLLMEIILPIDQTMLLRLFSCFKFIHIIL